MRHFAAVYVRQFHVNSRPSQDQVTCCRKKAESLGYTIDPACVIVDTGGGVELDRPAAMKLRALVKSGRVSAVFVMSRNELTRGHLEPLEQLEEEFRRYEIALYTECDEHIGDKEAPHRPGP